MPALTLSLGCYLALTLSTTSEPTLLSLHGPSRLWQKSSLSGLGQRRPHRLLVLRQVFYFSLSSFRLDTHLQKRLPAPLFIYSFFWGQISLPTHQEFKHFASPATTQMYKSKKLDDSR
ncbi:hypothetical protein KSP40_PGU003830 [Platanthera guangdongensis]|uniref:Secreted protein n=1 Tax=Platanthera guangdongensis TaxID=2320717 RepID=A0ABR2LIP2_9ASPA